MVTWKRLERIAEDARYNDQASVLSRQELLGAVRKQLHHLRFKPRQHLLQEYESGGISRREFLKMVGVISGGIVLPTGLAVSESELGSITGWAASNEPDSSGSSGNAEEITVSSGSTETIELSDGETFENKFIDISADGASVMIHAKASDWTIRNVGIRGEHPGEQNFIQPSVTSGEGLIENVYIGDGAAQGSRGGIYVQSDPAHQGQLTFRGIHVAHISNNGLYGTSPGIHGQSGTIDVESSYFYSNNISNIRVGSSGGTSHVRNCTVEVDDTVPPCQANCSSPGATRSRGIWAWVGEVQVSDSDIQGDPAFDTSDGGSFTRDNVNEGSNANTEPPEGVPMSAEEAACISE